MARTTQIKDINILYENEYLVAINKPAGLLSVPDRIDPIIVNVKHLFQADNDSIRVVHRLDRDTSGVMVLPNLNQANAT